MLGSDSGRHNLGISRLDGFGGVGGIETTVGGGSTDLLGVVALGFYSGISCDNILQVADVGEIITKLHLELVEFLFLQQILIFL